LQAAANEVVGLFVDDPPFAFALALWLAAMAGAGALAIATPQARALALFAGLVTILLVSVVGAARR
jgi:hypothetical protein